MPIDELRSRANAGELVAMEELARRLVHGAGVAKDQQAGAGWLLRAAQRGSAQSAFNVAVMYERGFVVERDSTKAIEWYRKAVDANVPMAKHNLALLLRDGKGAPRNGQEAVVLLRSAARQGMAASMFSLGDIYERGDAGTKDPAIALAWFAIAAEFERQTSGNESALAKVARQRAEVLQRILLPGELERAQQFGQAEFKQIVEALQPPKPAPAPAETTAMPRPALPERMMEADPQGWPKAANEQVRVIQQALVELKLLRDKPDGAVGPVTRNAIRTFQRGVPMRETGEPTREVFIALQEAMARRDGARAESSKAEAATVEAAKTEEAKPEEAKAEAAKAEAAKSEAARAEAAGTEATGVTASKVDPPKPPLPTIDTTKPAMPAIAVEEPAKAELAERIPDVWPSTTVAQVKAIQTLLRDLKFSREAPDGVLGPATRTAIRDYERSLGLAQTGEVSKTLFDSLKEMHLLTASKPN
jgi:TPR repeat protein/peptidoglycan hydrolase-like protein with peptidoglycan-binding domain